MSLQHKPLTDADQAKLDSLNAAVDRALVKRSAWLDSKMEEYSPVKVGEALYNLKTCEAVGTVSRFFRYWAEQNPLYDNSFSVNCEYETRPNSRDNTSRQSDRFGSAEDCRAALREQLEAIA